jgi:hypothetical protein
VTDINDLKLYPAHAASLHIEHNPHKAYYSKIEDEEDPNGGCFANAWVSPEQRAKAIAADSVWVVQWYPNTPVGSYKLCGADLDVVLAAAREVSPP